MLRNEKNNTTVAIGVHMSLANGLTHVGSCTCKTTDQLQEYNAIIYYVDVRNIPMQVAAIVVKDSYSYCSSLGSESLCS